MLLTIVIIHILGCLLPTVIAKDCTVNSFPVQADFHIERYLGRWYEMEWYSDKYHASTDPLYEDFTHVYTKQSDGNISILSTGRDPTANKRCVHYHSTFFLTDTPAKLKMDILDKGNLSDYWVIKTDYTNYAVVYKCFEENPDGTCWKAKSWVFSRHPSLADDLLAEADHQIEQVCLNATLFYTTHHRNGCSQDPSTVVG